MPPALLQGSHIDFMFLGPPPLDPMLICYNFTLVLCCSFNFAKHYILMCSHRSINIFNTSQYVSVSVYVRMVFMNNKHLTYNKHILS